MTTDELIKLLHKSKDRFGNTGISFYNRYGNPISIAYSIRFDAKGFYITIQ